MRIAKSEDRRQVFPHFVQTYRCKTLCQGSCLTRQVGMRNRPFFDRMDRFACLPTQDEYESHLDRLRDDRRRHSVDFDVGDKRL